MQRNSLQHGAALIGPVGMIVPPVAGGGLDRSVFAIAAGMVAAGHDVQLLLLDSSRPTGVEVPAGVRHHRVPNGRVREVGSVLARWARDHDARVLHATNERLLQAATLAGIRLGGRVRITGAVHTRLLDRAHPSLSGPKGWVVRGSTAQAFRRAASIVAVSRGIANNIHAVTGRSRDLVDVIHNPVMEQFAGTTPGTAPHAWLADEGLTVVTVGRLHEAKDHATLLDAVALLQRSNPQVRLIVVGDGPLLSVLQEQAGETCLPGSVVFVGHQTDAPDWVRHASIYAQSSRYEGLSRTAIEALAVGTPVVATDAPHGLREILGEGRFGDLVEVGDAHALATAMERRLDDPWLPDLGDHLDQFTLAQAVAGYTRIWS